MAFADLNALRAHLGIDQRVVVAIEEFTGTLNNQISNLSLVPEDVYRQGVANAQIIVTPAVPAQGQNAAVPAVTRNFFPVEKIILLSRHV